MVKRGMKRRARRVGGWKGQGGWGSRGLGKLGVNDLI